MTARNTEVRAYQAKDARSIVQLFYETVRSVNRAHYSQAQVMAWAPRVPDAREWHQRMSGRRTLVAEKGGEVVGFAELVEEKGHLDMLYVRKDAVGTGVGGKLYEAVERQVRGLGPKRVSTEASITARPFFEQWGFRVVREQTVVARGVSLVNFVMEKQLHS